MSLHSTADRKRRKDKRIIGLIAVSTAVTAGISLTPVFADDGSSAATGGVAVPIVVENQNASETNDQKTPDVVFEISGTDLRKDLEEKVIKYCISQLSQRSVDDVDMDKSIFSSTKIDPLNTGVQTVTIDMVLVDKNGDRIIKAHEALSVRVKSQTSTGKMIIVKNNNLIVDYQSPFNYMNNITLVTDQNNKLPAVTETDNVDVNKEGTYNCSVTALNALGESETVSFNVTVKKPEEVLRKEEEERKAAEAKAKAEQEATEAAARQAAANAAAQAALAQQRAATPAVASAGTAAATPTAANILSIARSWVGVGRYVWGGTNPATGADCSGFTQYVFGQVGIGLNRTAASQAYNGYRVSADQARPGDLVVWSGHVGIYSGNGMMINAENPYRGIREDPVSGFMASGYFMGYYRIPGVN